MGRRKVDKLLGKKRITNEDKSDKEEVEDSEEEESENNNKNIFIYEDSEEEESSESEDSKPVQRLFAENESGFTKSLFDNKSDQNKEAKDEGKKSLFDFSSKEKQENKSSSLFDNKPLFDFSIKNKEEKQENKSSSLFGDQPLFGSSSNNKEENNENKSSLFGNKEEKKEEKEEEGDDNIGKSNSPKREYNPEIDDKEKNKDDNNVYVKRYVKKVEKVFLYDKEEKKYISKGEGFISIETMTTKKDDKEKKDGIVVLRNTFGGLMLEGFLNEKINKFESKEIKGKFLAIFVLLVNDKKNNISMTHCKIPFNTKEDFEHFQKVYNETIKYLKLEIKEFSE